MTDTWRLEVAMTTLIRCFVVFLILAVTLGTNVEDNIIARLGLTANYGSVVGAALIGTALIANRNIFIIAAIVIFSLNANMPTDFIMNFGFDRDFYAGLMLAIVFQPFLVRVLE